jgi:hypothetical protein
LEEEEVKAETVLQNDSEAELLSGWKNERTNGGGRDRQESSAVAERRKGAVVRMIVGKIFWESNQPALARWNHARLAWILGRHVLVTSLVEESLLTVAADAVIEIARKRGFFLCCTGRKDL